VMIGAGFGELNFSWMLGAVCLLVAAGGGGGGGGGGRFV